MTHDTAQLEDGEYRFGKKMVMFHSNQQVANMPSNFLQACVKGTCFQGRCEDRFDKIVGMLCLMRSKQRRSKQYHNQVCKNQPTGGPSYGGQHALHVVASSYRMKESEQFWKIWWLTRDPTMPQLCNYQPTIGPSNSSQNARHVKASLFGCV